MVLIGNNIAIYLLSNQVTNIYLKNGFSANSLIFGFLPWNAEVIATLTLIFPVFLFAEIIPKIFLEYGLMISCIRYQFL